MDRWTRHYRRSCTSFTSKWLLLSIHRKGGRRMFKSQQPKHTNHRRIAWRWSGRAQAGAVRDIALVKGGIHTCCGFKTSSGLSNGSCKVKSTLVFLSQPDRDSSDYFDFISFQHRPTRQTLKSWVSVASASKNLPNLFLLPVQTGTMWEEEPPRRGWW